MHCYKAENKTAMNADLFRRVKVFIYIVERKDTITAIHSTRTLLVCIYQFILKTSKTNYIFKDCFIGMTQKK